MLLSLPMRSVCCVVMAGCFVLIQGCAPNVRQQPTSALQAAPIPHRIQLDEAADAHIGTGTGVDLKAGTTWQLVGSISEGDVYKPLDQALNVEGSHVHEAYAVISNSTLVGFYLPFEKTFVKASTPVPLSIHDK
jgi:hypothetical protein